MIRCELIICFDMIYHPYNSFRLKSCCDTTPHPRRPRFQVKIISSGDFDVCLQGAKKLDFSNPE